MLEIGTPETSSLTEEDWYAHVDAWKNAGLSKAEYCRKHGLSRDSFYYWNKKSLRNNPTPPDDGFIEVTSKQNQLSPRSITVEIYLPNQVRLSLNLPEAKLLNLIRGLANATSTIR